MRSLVPLDESAAEAEKKMLFLRLFNYGSGDSSEGYWNNELMIRQVDEFIDVFEHKFPDCTALLSFDWSTGHSAYSKDAMLVTNMNTLFGGKTSAKAYQIKPYTTVKQNFISNNKVLLGTGDRQYLYFQDGDNPPFYKPNLRKEEYVGAPKGMKQILWERGLWCSGMTRTGKSVKNGVVHRNPNLSMEDALNACLDFKEELADCALAQFIRSRGHRCDFTPKYHCECSAIEYCWGRSKLFIRKLCTYVYADMVSKIPHSLSSENLPLYTIRKYFRMTRDYARVYLTEAAACEAVKAVKKLKSHRSTLLSEYDGLGVRHKPWSKTKEQKENWFAEKKRKEEEAAGIGAGPSLPPPPPPAAAPPSPPSAQTSTRDEYDDDDIVENAPAVAEAAMEDGDWVTMVVFHDDDEDNPARKEEEEEEEDRYWWALEEEEEDEGSSTTTSSSDGDVTS